MAEDKKKFMQKIRALYFNTQLRRKHKKFAEVLNAECIEDSDKIALKIKKNIEESILETVNYISDIQYYMMEKTGHWGEYGQQRVVIGFARLKLGIAPEADITQRDINEFTRLMNSNNELKALSPKRLKEIEEETNFTVLGKTIKLHRSDLVNRELAFIGSKNRISIGMYGKHRSIIYGIAKSMRKEGYELYLFDKEIARTPSNIMSIAAVIGQKDVGIRKESCRLIFEMKWKKMFEYNEREKAKMYNNEAGNIREMIKVRALEAYNVKDAQELEKIKDTFVDEMIEGIIWHEFGHGVFFNEELETEAAGISKAFSYFGENIVGILHEVLADWAVRMTKLKGPVQHFIEIALDEGDPQKANRMLLVYMSDNWFLDFKEEFLGSQTDLMISILCPFLNDDFTFDFHKMREMFDTVHDLMMDESIKIIDLVIEKAKKAVYHVGKNRYHFEFIEENIDKFVKGDNMDADKGSMLYKTAFWNNVFLLMERMAKDDYHQAVNILKEQDIEVKKKLMQVMAPEKAPEYNGKIRDYLFDQMKTKGFFKEVQSLGSLDAINMALDEIDVFSDEKETVFNKFKSIYDGKDKYLAKVNYEDSFDFFNCAIQEMLVTTQLGEINRELIVRNDQVKIMQPGQQGVSHTDSAIKDKLKELADMFNDQQVLSVLTMTVNITIEKLDDWYQLIGDVKLDDDTLLISKIDHVTAEPMDSNILFRIHVPVEYGYMCYSTVKAVERINKILRDNDSNKHLIDKQFIDFIAFEYNNTY